MSLSPCEFQTWSCFRQIGKQRAGLVLDSQRAFAVFAFLAFLDLAAEELREQLHAEANAEHRHAELENVFVRQRRVLGINRLDGPPDKMMPLGLSAAIFTAGVS